MKVTINDKEIELKNKLRAILIYEQITEKVFNPTSMTDMMLYFYCVILANEPSINLTFIEFMDMLDDEPELFENFNKWLIQLNKVNGQYNESTDGLKKNLSK